MADLMEFSNRTGTELAHVLAQRAKDELSDASDNDRFTAMLGASLIATAEVLRAPVESGANVEKLLAFSTRWLRTLLAPLVNQGAEDPT